MTNPTYTSLAATAQRLMDRFGQAMTLRRVVNSAYDTSTGTVTQATTDYAVNGVVQAYKESRVDGSIIRRGDKQVIVAGNALTFAPDPDTDRLLIGGVDHAVVNVEEENPGGLALVYTLQVREAA